MPCHGDNMESKYILKTECAPSNPHYIIHPFSKTHVLGATTHTRLRARDHYILSTLIGGKGGAGPSSLQTSLEGPTCECKMGIKSTWIPTWHQMDYVS